MSSMYESSCLIRSHIASSRLTGCKQGVLVLASSSGESIMVVVVVVAVGIFLSVIATAIYTDYVIIKEAVHCDTTAGWQWWSSHSWDIHFYL